MSKSYIRDSLLRMPPPMMDPALDDEPGEFCYFSRPTDQLAWPRCREFFQLTAEGFPYSVNMGQLVLMGGNPPVELQVRKRMLADPRAPIYDLSRSHDGFDYTFRHFAAPADYDTPTRLFLHSRITVTNTGRTRRVGYFGTGVRFVPPSQNPWGIGDNAYSDYIGSIPREHRFFFEQDLHFENFNPEWRFFRKGGTVSRNGGLLYLHQSGIEPEFDDSLFSYIQGYRPYNRRHEALPSTIAGVCVWQKALDPGESFTVDLVMPAEELALDSRLAREMAQRNFEDEERKLRRHWEQLFERTPKVTFPEEKLQATWQACLVQDLLALDEIDGQAVQKVNRFQYNTFWLRDASFIARAYDVFGHHDAARDVLLHFLKWQKADGLFVSQGGQYDGIGQVLWGFGQHLLLTGDMEFAERVLPACERAVDWIAAAIRKDLWGLIPETTPGDNEAISGHITGHNFWALLGLDMIARAAKLAGNEGLAAEANTVSNRLRTALGKRLEVLLLETENYIPPGLDFIDGEDWGNLLAAYPSETLTPTDPAVRKTMEVARSKYREGIMTYFQGLFLHHYLTYRIAATEMLGGNVPATLEDLYNALLHTSSTHATFETRMVPWAGRDFGFNMSPHGWSSAELLIFLRNLLVIEYAGDLRLFSGVSPAWLAPGKRLAFERLPTEFGPVSGSLSLEEPGKLVVEFSPEFGKKPSRVLFPVPFFVDVREVTTKGARLMTEEGVQFVELALEADRVTMSVAVDESVAPVCFETAVERFKAEWRKRHAHWQKTGEVLPEKEYDVFPELRQLANLAASPIY